jgi:hypothetical protein
MNCTLRDLINDKQWKKAVDYCESTDKPVHLLDVLEAIEKNVPLYALKVFVPCNCDKVLVARYMCRAFDKRKIRIFRWFARYRLFSTPQVISKVLRAPDGRDWIEFLLIHGADLREYDKNGWAAIHHIAEANKNLGLGKILHEDKDLVNYPTRDTKMTMLHFACLPHVYGLIRFSVKFGANVLAVDAEGRKPIDYLKTGTPMHRYLRKEIDNTIVCLSLVAMCSAKMSRIGILSPLHTVSIDILRRLQFYLM